MGQNIGSRVPVESGLGLDHYQLLGFGVGLEGSRLRLGSSMSQLFLSPLSSHQNQSDTDDRNGITFVDICDLV